MSRPGPFVNSRLSTMNCPSSTKSVHSGTMGNRCPTSRTRSHIYHYITYPCRHADIFASQSRVTIHEQRVTSHAGNLLNCKLSIRQRMLILSEPGESKDHSSSDSVTVNCRLGLPGVAQTFTLGYP